MYKTQAFEEKFKVANCRHAGPAPIPCDGQWVQAKKIEDISGLSHGVGGCAPQQGACKITINVKKGIIEECLVETVGCTGMTHSAAMAAEILPGKTLLEGLNTDLVCDAINVAYREVFLQLVYGRSQTAFTEGGLPVGACEEDLGKNRNSTMASTLGSREKGARYLNLTEGYITKLSLDENNEIIGYEFVNTNKMMQDIADGKDANEALSIATKQYGRYTDGVKFIDPRKE